MTGPQAGPTNYSGPLGWLSLSFTCGWKGFLLLPPAQRPPLSSRAWQEGKPCQDSINSSVAQEGWEGVVGGGPMWTEQVWGPPDSCYRVPLYPSRCCGVPNCSFKASARCSAVILDVKEGWRQETGAAGLAMSLPSLIFKVMECSGKRSFHSWRFKTLSLQLVCCR